MWKFHQYFQVLHVVVFSCSCHIIYMYPQNNTATATNTTNTIATTTNTNDGYVPNKLKASSIHTRSSNSNSNNHIEALDLMHSSNSNRHVAVDSRELVTIAERVHSNDKIDRMNANENFTTLIQNALDTNKQQQQQQQQKQKHYINNKIVGSLAAAAISTTMPSNGGNVMESVDEKIVEDWKGYQANSSDDLIFLVSRPVVVTNSQQQQQQQQSKPNYKEFSQVDQANDLLTVASSSAAVTTTAPTKSAIEAQDSLTSVSGRLSITNDNDYNNNNNHNNDNDNDAEDYIEGDAGAATSAAVVTDTTAHKIQIQLSPTTTPLNRTNDNSYEDDAHDDEQFSIITALDLSEFAALIPIEQAKAIAKYYQQHDAEVREAYAFMASDEFERLQQHILQVPEMTDLLHYLNSSGLDLVNLLRTLTNFTQSHLIAVYDEDNNGMGDNEVGLSTTTPEAGSLSPLTSSTTLKSLQINENSSSTLSTDLSTLNTLFIPNNHLQGLQGLLENILEILPQDQLLALFLEKLETKEVFSHLFERLGSDVFAHILRNLQNSTALHHLTFTLHRHGINVMRLIDILKSYFFVGTF